MLQTTLHAHSFMFMCVLVEYFSEGASGIAHSVYVFVLNHMCNNVYIRLCVSDCVLCVGIL